MEEEDEDEGAIASKVTTDDPVSSVDSALQEMGVKQQAENSMIRTIRKMSVLLGFIFESEKYEKNRVVEKKLKKLECQKVSGRIERRRTVHLGDRRRVSSFPLFLARSTHSGSASAAGGDRGGGGGGSSGPTDKNGTTDERTEWTRKMR